MLGFGFSGTIFYLQNQPTQLGQAAAAAVGLYFCTIFINLPGVIVSALLGIGGSGLLAYHLFTT